MTNHEAARVLGVSLMTLTRVARGLRDRLRGCAKRVPHPNGGRCIIYPLAEIECIVKARAAAPKDPWLKREHGGGSGNARAAA